MNFLMPLIGALAFSYFGSRIALRFSGAVGGWVGLLIAHAASLAMITLIILAMRYPLGVFSPRQVGVFLVPQVFWFLFDYLRGTFPRKG